MAADIVRNEVSAGAMPAVGLLELNPKTIDQILAAHDGSAATCGSHAIAPEPAAADPATAFSDVRRIPSSQSCCQSCS
jgi:hypothetical protein